MTVYLDVHRVIELHALGESAPLLDRATLEGAVARCQAGFGDEDAFPRLVDKAAALLHGIASTQCFQDGNKRAAWLSTVVFLELNGFDFPLVPDIEAEAFVMAVAVSGWSDRTVMKAAEWLDSRIRATGLDHPHYGRELWCGSMLLSEAAGYDTDDGRINIHRGLFHGLVVDALPARTGPCNLVLEVNVPWEKNAPVIEMELRCVAPSGELCVLDAQGRRSMDIALEIVDLATTEPLSWSACPAVVPLDVSFDEFGSHVFQLFHGGQLLSVCRLHVADEAAAAQAQAAQEQAKADMGAADVVRVAREALLPAPARQIDWSSADLSETFRQSSAGATGLRAAHVRAALQNPDAIEGFDIGGAAVYMATKSIDVRQPFTMLIHADVQGRPGIVNAWRLYDEPADDPLHSFGRLISACGVPVRVGGLVRSLFVPFLNIPGFKGEPASLVTAAVEGGRTYTVHANIFPSSAGDFSVAWAYALDEQRYDSWVSQSAG